MKYSGQVTQDELEILTHASGFFTRAGIEGRSPAERWYPARKTSKGYEICIGLAKKGLMEFTKETTYGAVYTLTEAGLNVVVDNYVNRRTFRKKPPST